MAKIDVTYPGIPDAYIQVVGTPESGYKTPVPGRYQVGTFHGREAARFELHPGDYWQGPASSDARNFRERIERAAHEKGQGHILADEAAPWVREHIDLFVDPAEFDVSGPDVKHFQFFDRSNGYPLGFLVRRTGGQMQFLINAKISGDATWRGKSIDVPFVEGEWNAYDFDLLPRPGIFAAGLRIRHDGAVVFEATGMSLIEDDCELIYGKSGLYRSDVDEWEAANPGQKPPVVVCFNSGVSRVALDAPVVEPGPVVTPAAPVEPPPVVTPAPTPKGYRVEGTFLGAPFSFTVTPCA